MALDQRQPLVLGSASPRRRELLEQLGVRFTLLPSHVEEPEPSGQTPEAYARALAADKCRAVIELARARGEAGFVLTADTIVVVDSTVLNKPADDADAARMLRALQGRGHEVITAVCLRGLAGSFSQTVAVRTTVEFRALSERDVAAYVATGEGRDKAGAYAIQGVGAGVVRQLAGSYTNVVGLPLCETIDLLVQAGVLGGFP